MDNFNKLTDESIELIPNKFLDRYGALKDYSGAVNYSISKISVQEGEVYKFRGKTSPSYNKIYCLYKDDDLVYGNINTESIYGKEVVIIIPNNVNILYVQNQYTQYPIYKLTQDYNQNIVTEEINDINKEIDYINDEKLGYLFNTISHKEDKSLEISIEIGKYIDSEGNIKDSSNYRVGHYTFLNEDKNNVFKITGCGYTNNCLFVLRDSNEKILKKYLVKSSDSNEVTSINVFIDESVTDIYIEGFLNNYPKICKLKSSNPFTLLGKKWTAFGDSLTERNSRTTKNYCDYISEVTGLIVHNMGKSGTGYARLRENHIAFYQRVLNIPDDSDVITIFGSGNDLGAGLELGNPTDTSDTETLCGYINKTIDLIQQDYPLIPLGIITPTPWINLEPSQSPNEMSNYSDAIEKICKRRGVPCLNLYYCSNLHPSNQSFRQLAYSKDDGNGVHPDETGHKIIAPRIEAFLKELLLN